MARWSALKPVNSWEYVIQIDNTGRTLPCSLVSLYMIIMGVISTGYTMFSPGNSSPVVQYNSFTIFVRGRENIFKNHFHVEEICDCQSSPCKCCRNQETWGCWRCTISVVEKSPSCTFIDYLAVFKKEVLLYINFYFGYSTLLTKKDLTDDFVTSMGLNKMCTVISDYQHSGFW